MRLSRFALHFGSPVLVLISSSAVSAQELPATVPSGGTAAAVLGGAAAAPNGCTEVEAQGRNRPIEPYPANRKTITVQTLGQRHHDHS
jgi:hypothetical protein